jgi:hypothetical protein
MAAQSEGPVYPRVCLTTMARESISIWTHAGIVQAMTTGRAAYHLAIEAGPYLDDGRNKCIGNALAIRDEDDNLLWDWHLFVDSDIEFANDHLEALFAPTAHADYDPTVYPFNDSGVPGDVPDAAGGYFGPVAYEWTERDDLPGEKAGVPTMAFRRLSRAAFATRPPVNEFWNADGQVTQVDAIGTGFLAIHASLLTKMYEHYGEPLPWFDEPIRNGVHLGEDFGFALRCMDLGYPVLAHRGCTPMHNKTTKLI